VRTREEVKEKVAMFYRAKRESDLTEQQHKNCDSAIQILKWILEDSQLGENSEN